MEEEISLREIIEVLLKGKWIIAIFTAVCVFLSGIYSVFLMEPIYNAKSTLMVSPVIVEGADDPNNKFSDLVGSLSQYPQMTLDTYMEQVKTPKVLNAVIQELKLDEKYEMTRSSLSSIIEVGSPKNTNLIYITVEHKDSKLAADIANAVSNRFVDFISDKLQEQTGKSAEFIAEQLEVEKVSLEKSTQELTTFLAKPRGVDELRQELSSKLSQLTEFKTKVTQVKIDNESTSAALSKARQALDTTPVTLKTTKSLASDALMSQIAVENSGQQLKDLAGLQMTDEQLNPAYTSLLLNVKNYEIQLTQYTAQLSSITREIETRQKEIEQLQAELAEKENQYETLNHEVQMGKQTRDAYQQKLKEATIKQSAEIGRSSIIVVSDALPPIKPTNNNKLLIIAIAGVLGIMLSAFGVFFMNYWKNSGNDVKSKTASV
ncbi:MAG: GumC family protein [Clostridia bacterium]